MDIEQPNAASANSERTPYAILGGAPVVRHLVDAFYDQMDEDPDYFDIRKLHPASLSVSREKLYMFLTGWLGGPPLYTVEFGDARLRARHLPFPIGAAERDQWMACMTGAMEAVKIEHVMRQKLLESFASTADWMRNREG